MADGAKGHVIVNIIVREQALTDTTDGHREMRSRHGEPSLYESVGHGDLWLLYAAPYAFV